MRRMSPRGPAQRALIVLAALLVVDLGLTLVLYSAGTVHAGKAPLLDTWDVVKAFVTAALLLRTAAVTGARGVGMFGIVFLVIGLVDATSFHAVLARPLAARVPLDEIFGVHPASAEGVAEMIVLMVIGGLLVAGLVVFRDQGPDARRTRWVFLSLLAALIVFAGVIDVVDDLNGINTIWSVVEEFGERVVFTLSTAFSFYLWAGARETPATGAGPEIS